MADEDDMDNEDDGTNASTTADQISDIDVSGCDLVKCNTCGAAACDATPFRNPRLIKKWGNFHPWHRYFKKRNRLTGSFTTKFPQGAQCGICVNTFRALGLNIEHGTLGKYFKVISLPNKREEGPKFVRAVKTFINQLNKNPERCKLKDKDELKDAFTIVATVDKMGYQDSGAERKFVSVEDWDEAEDGPLDQSKVVDEFFMGQTVKGCWVVHGRKGVYFRKPIATKVLENRTELSDGGGPFADTREKKILDTYVKLLEDKAKKVSLFADCSLLPTEK
jgi:hypothetical protein